METKFAYNIHYGEDTDSDGADLCNSDSADSEDSDPSLKPPPVKYHPSVIVKIPASVSNKSDVTKKSSLPPLRRIQKIRNKKGDLSTKSDCQSKECLNTFDNEELLSIRDFGIDPKWFQNKFSQENIITNAHSITLHNAPLEETIETSVNESSIKEFVNNLYHVAENFEMEHEVKLSDFGVVENCFVSPEFSQRNITTNATILTISDVKLWKKKISFINKRHFYSCALNDLNKIAKQNEDRIFFSLGSAHSKSNEFSQTSPINIEKTISNVPIVPITADQYISNVYDALTIKNNPMENSNLLSIKKNSNWSVKSVDQSGLYDKENQNQGSFDINQHPESNEMLQSIFEFEEMANANQEIYKNSPNIFKTDLPESFEHHNLLGIDNILSDRTILFEEQVNQHIEGNESSKIHLSDSNEKVSKTDSTVIQNTSEEQIDYKEHTQANVLLESIEKEIKHCDNLVDDVHQECEQTITNRKRKRSKKKKTVNTIESTNIIPVTPKTCVHQQTEETGNCSPQQTKDTLQIISTETLSQNTPLVNSSDSNEKESKPESSITFYGEENIQQTIPNQKTASGHEIVLTPILSHLQNQGARESSEINITQTPTLLENANQPWNISSFIYQKSNDYKQCQILANTRETSVSLLDTNEMPQKRSKVSLTTFLPKNHSEEKIEKEVYEEQPPLIVVNPQNYYSLTSQTAFPTNRISLQHYLATSNNSNKRIAKLGVNNICTIHNILCERDAAFTKKEEPSNSNQKLQIYQSQTKEITHNVDIGVDKSIQTVETAGEMQNSQLKLPDLPELQSTECKSSWKKRFLSFFLSKNN